IRMMISPLLVLSIATAVVSIGRTPKDCTIGEKWTDKFIRLECFKGVGRVVNGVRAIGCVPTNSEKGEMIEPGKTFNEQHFTYSCTKKGTAVSYHIINCLDSKGQVLAVGQKTTMTEGTEWSCFKDKSGAIKLEQLKTGQCSYNGVTLAVGKTWSEPAEIKITVGGVEKVVGKAIAKVCATDGKLGFFAKAYGCVTATGLWIKHRAFSKVHADFVQC
ncbi:hypothetical protein PMAYCL1PPCAC_00913, partial [Pristionchus mayeri]